MKFKYSVIGDNTAENRGWLINEQNIDYDSTRINK